MLTILSLLATLGATGFDSPATPALKDDRPPVRLWMNSDRRFRPGDRVRLQVDADVDGYLLVLNYDTDGRVRVLFPLEPRDDASVRAGRRYEVRTGNGNEAFRAGGDGTGLIYTAVSPEPWRFDQVTLNDRWDYTRLEVEPNTSNPEEALTNVVQSIAGSQGFDYDVLGYRVYRDHDYSYNLSNYPAGPIYVYDDYLYCNNWSWRYNGCRRWPYDGGWAFGSGFYFGYSPYRYGYYPYGYFGGYYGSYPYYGGYYRRGPVAVGRPRSYTLVPRNSYGNTFGSGAVGGVRGSAPSRDFIPPAINWRSRPSGGRPVSGNSGNGDAVRGSGRSAPDMPPPARRSRPDDGGGFPAAARGGDRGNDRPSYQPRSRDGGGGSPAPRAEPARRDPPPRSEPSRSSGSGGGGHSSPPPSRPRRP